MRFPRSSGVLLHPTSLPGSYGIGDIGPSAYSFVEFLADTGQLWWQVLPLGPTGAGNSPYQSHSSFAGNPLLISPEALVRRGWLEVADTREFQESSTDHVDFPEVQARKDELLSRAHRSFPTNDPAFEDFVERNAFWLEDYALYTALKEVHDDSTWVDWEPAIARREPAAMESWRSRLSDRVQYHQFVQFVFDGQWRALKERCKARGIKLIGDIPIFVSHDSADVWARPDLFFLDEVGRPTHVAGVPPDYFSETGQLWGNPLYRWEVHAAEGYSWWLERLSFLLDRVDLIRLDHFRGFEAYWEVPGEALTAETGRWAPGPGASFFKVVQARFVGLPLIAEDLGLITREVSALREAFGLPGMRVLQFGFGADADAARNLPHMFENHCVAYTGTHDNDTSQGWLAAGLETTLSPEQNRAERAFALEYVGSDGSDFAWDLIRLALGSIADIVITPMQDLLSLDSGARMNIPGKAEGNWGWRLDDEALSDDLKHRLGKLTALFDRWNGTIPPQFDPRHRSDTLHDGQVSQDATMVGPGSDPATEADQVRKR